MKFSPLLFILSLYITQAQSQYPKDYFRLPLDIPMQLSGNFGELRPNHFHAGFDFKTNQREGLNVYAAADGYISRIKISTAGYGKAIYITHPNGYTTVYGHLQKAIGKIQDKIIELQYADKSYEIEAFFKPDELTVKKGDIIALSGNTGGSEGPHLHFEFRENKTEKIINPLFFGFNLKDTKKPTVSNLLAYPIDNNSIINESKRPVILNLSLQQDGTYLSENVLANGKIGFGINANDTDDVSFNPNGVYKSKVISNGKTIFGYELDEMVFDEARLINYFIDYSRYKRSHQRVQKLFAKQYYEWSNITPKNEDGIFNVTPNFLGLQRIEVSDYFDNKTTINIPITYSAKPAIIKEETKITKYFIKAKQDSNFEKDNFSAYFPAGTFYEDFYMNFDVKNNILQLHDDTVPTHASFTVTYEDTKSEIKDKSKAFIAAVNGNKLSYITTKLNGNTLSCKTKTLGQFTIAKDTVAPKISIKKSVEGKNISKMKSISLTISDDLTGVRAFYGYMNDKWVLFEYESKLKRITHEFNEKYLNDGDNKLKVIVMDNVGNSTTFETQFIRSQK
jgi:hypothetical protein